MNLDKKIFPPVAHMTILFAEDDATMRNFVTESLERAGFKVVPFENGSALSQWLDQNEVSSETHLLLSDVFMPGASAFELLERHRYQLSKLSIILISGFGTEHLHDKATRLGASAVIDKPFEMHDLKELILKLALPHPHGEKIQNVQTEPFIPPRPSKRKRPSTTC